MTQTDEGTRAPVYAGIGSWKTPREVLDAMTRVARARAAERWVLHSGGADGADGAFAAGAPVAKRTIYLPWPRVQQPAGTRHRGARRRRAGGRRKAPPGVGELRPGGRSLQGRNHAIIHGVRNAGSDRRVDAVFCWTPDGRLTGGTATGIRMARAAGVPVLNMARCSEQQVLASLSAIGRRKSG